MPTNEKGHNAIEISIFHQKPQTNMFNGRSESGGFYISFKSGELKQESGYTSFVFDLLAGYKIKIAEGSRDSSKKRLQMIEKVTEELAKEAFSTTTYVAPSRIQEFLK